MTDEKLLISPEMARAEAELLLGKPVSLRVVPVSDPARQLQGSDYWFQSGQDAVRVTVTDADRSMSMKDFSARILAAVVAILNAAHR